MNIMDRLRDNLKPKGTAPVVQLQLANFGMFDSNFISQCIDEIERMKTRVVLGDGPTALEKLAIQLLMDSAYIDIEHELKQRELNKNNQQSA